MCILILMLFCTLPAYPEASGQVTFHLVELEPYDKKGEFRISGLPDPLSNQHAIVSNFLAKLEWSTGHGRAHLIASVSRPLDRPSTFAMNELFAKSDLKSAEANKALKSLSVVVERNDPEIAHVLTLSQEKSMPSIEQISIRHAQSLGILLGNSDVNKVRTVLFVTPALEPPKKIKSQFRLKSDN